MEREGQIRIPRAAPQSAMGRGGATPQRSILAAKRLMLALMEHHAHDHAGHAHDHGHAPQAPKLTAARRRVLDIMKREGRLLGAYDLIELLTAETGKRVAPISVYRALDYLRDHGLVHRLASRNAYMACGHTHRHDHAETVIFLICDQCKSVSEATSARVHADLSEVAKKAGFAAKAEMVEITGTCAACQAA